MEQSYPTALSRRNIVLLAAAGVLMLAAAFYLSPIPEGHDWNVLHGFVQLMLQGKSLYQNVVPLSATDPNTEHFWYAPWVAVLLTPVGALPTRVGLALVRALSVMMVILVGLRFHLSPLKLALSLLSPPVAYILFHGQIDALALGVLFLPGAWQIIGCTVKPQVTMTFFLRTPRKEWVRGLLIAAGIFLLSLLVFGPWPLEWLANPKTPYTMGHNLWRDVWPLQVPIGLAVLFYALRKKDERYLAAASPLLSPYAPISTMIGPWLALSGLLEDWQALVVVVAWWATILYRSLYM
jgi:hypothetical protein